jgi:hypothetical protein
LLVKDAMRSRGGYDLRLCPSVSTYFPQRELHSFLV